MRILLIGNFAPPYEEENLHNISLLKRLEDEGHNCTVINISENPSTDSRFINAADLFGFICKLVRYGWRKQVIHFFTKGYLRLGLLKLMFSVLIGTLFRSKTFITIHSELFTIQGQMRSPFGGRQTLFTSFTLAKKIICADKDTYDIASMYMKRSNFELVPSFISVPPEIIKDESPSLKKLRDREKVIIFSNVQFPSFIFEIIKELLTDSPLPSDVGIVLSLSERPASKLQHVFEEIAKDMQDQLVFIDRDDIKAALLAYSKADIVVRPMSCDGTTFFESFAISARKLMHVDNNIYFPGGSLFIKEGDMAAMCVLIINTMLSSGPFPAVHADSYERIKEIYQEK